MPTDETTITPEELDLLAAEALKAAQYLADATEGRVEATHAQNCWAMAALDAAGFSSITIGSDDATG